MFPKNFKIGKEYILSSKDKKKLQSKLKAIIISKKSKFKQVSVTGTKIKLYLEESETWTPFFIESDGFFPSIFLLWKLPDYLPVVYIWPSVSKFIMNGADLMWPGVVNPEEITGVLQVDSIVAVSVIDNVPMAVGIIVTDAPINNKGKCVKVLHYYRDELWMMFQSIPNEGFLIHEVTSILKAENEEETGTIKMIVEENLNSIPENQEFDKKEFIENQEFQKNDEVWSNLVLEELGLLDSFDENIISNELVHNEDRKINYNNEGIFEDKKEFIEQTEKNLEFNAKSQCENIENKDEIGEANQDNLKKIEINNELKESNPENDEIIEENKQSFEVNYILSPDEIIMQIFLTALLIAVKPEDFPLEPSNLQRLMHGCKRSYSLDFSKSSFKKIGKFLDHAKKLSIIQYEKPKNCDHKLIISYNSQHPMLETFVPIVRKLKICPNEILESVSNYPKVLFTSCVIPKFEYKDFFSVVVPERSHRAFQRSEVNSLLIDYLKIKGLESNKTTIKTDLVLQKALGCEEIVTKKEIYIKLQNLFEEGYLAEYTSGLLSQMVYYGTVPMISIAVFKGKGKYKKITVVKGFDSYLIDTDELQELTQKKFSAAATIVKEETKMKTFYYLQVSGNHSEKFPLLLNEYFKIPKSQIKVTIS